MHTKRKIANHLKTKDKSQYSHLDVIFELYVNGSLKKLLASYDSVGIYPSINRFGKAIQLEYSYQNIYVIIDFFEDKYNAVIYHAGASEEELGKLAIDYDYQDDFTLEKLIDEIDTNIKTHPKLKDMTFIAQKKKIYSLVAWISLCLPVVIFGGIGLYCMITERAVKGNALWGIFFIVIPLLVWMIFDIKAKRIK